MNVLEMSTRVGEADVSTLVERFYERARGDRSLGPVFGAQIRDDAWPAHLARMVDFWSTVLRGTGRYRGDPMVAHRSVPGLTRAHFAAWLGLFEVVVGETFEPDVAAAVLQRAHRMGDRLIASLGL